MTGPDGHFEFEGHILTSSNANFTSLKSQFVNRLISNINQRFPQQSLMNSFFVLAMRTINYESSPDEFGNEEIDAILKHFGEQQTHRGFISPAMFDKEEVKKEWGKAKTIVQSLKYPVENMKHLWQLLTEHHRDDIPNMVSLAQLALCLPLHTADCERTFSQQNRIVTKLRNRLLPDNCDKLLRVMTHGKGLQSHDFKQTLNIWISKKKRLIGIKRKSSN